MTTPQDNPDAPSTPPEQRAAALGLGAAAVRVYGEAVQGLLSHGGFERTGNVQQAKKWDVDHITAWLDANGRPDRRHGVHVAGSKGKGSVSALTEAILRAAGAHTLLLTSPDLHSARERIAIDGAPIGYAEFARIAQRLLDDPAAAGWSYFELLTVMGWIAGAEADCDWQVVEVGLGGRLDTTNAMAAKDVAVVTPIDLEHVEILGTTIPEIAGEKAGIITGPCEVVIAPMRASALEVIRQRAFDRGATPHEVAEECGMRVISSGLQGQRLDLRTPIRTYRNLETPLIAPFQRENLATAVRAAELAWAATGEELPEPAVHDAVRRFRMPGRFEVVKQKPLVIIDGLHTPLAARRFAEGLQALTLPRRRVWVLGMLSDKSIDAVIEPLLGEGDDVVVAPVASARGADVGAIVRAVNTLGAIAQRASSPEEAVDRALALAGDGGAVFVVGSLYLVAAAREHLLGIVGDHALGLR